jgi:uncharacterized protein
MATHVADNEPGGRTTPPGATAPRRSGAAFAELDVHECRALLASESVGRIGWASASGQLILPVTYVYVEEIIGFRTSPYSALAELIRPTQVAFEVESLDFEHHQGASVVIQGLTRVARQPDWSWGHPEWFDTVVPWAAGQRQLSIEISVTKITGRRIRRNFTG